ncbi:MAG: alpha-L-fucosidase [Armatimonadota bacterium]
MRHNPFLYGLLTVLVCWWAAQMSAVAGVVTDSIPARHAALVQQGKGTVEVDLLPDEAALQVNGISVPATLEDSYIKEGQPGRGGWQVEDETGVLVLQAPDGPGLRFTTGYLTSKHVPGIGAGPQWTLACWLRPDDPDWGLTIQRDGRVPRQLMRPVIAALGSETTPSWCLRLCQMRLEMEIGTWRVQGATRLPVGRWTHVAVVRDGKQVRVYVDGKAEPLVPALQPNGQPSTEQTLGPVIDPPEGEAAKGPISVLRLAGFPFNKVHPASEQRAAEIFDKYIGAMGSFSLEDKVWSAEEIKTRATVHRKEANRLSRRYSVLDDPTTGAISRSSLRMKESSEEFLTRTAWFRDGKFGMFLHWGPSTLTHKEISWSRGKGADQTPPEIYDNLYKQFNPVNYDPDVWAEQIKAAGMKYAVLITKHHDGFCEWPTKTTEYNIAFTPFAKDVVGMYTTAMRKAGVRVGLYFTGPDWWHEDYLKGKIGLAGYRNAQFRELCTQYGLIDEIWFDGGGSTFEGVERAQPQMLFNDRGGPADFSTPENFMLEHPMINPNGSDALWETCSGTGGPWGYASEKPGLTFPRTLSHLVEVVAKGGNWLCNVAPRETGELPKTHMDMLKGVGDWLRVNGESIYGTHRTHLGSQSFGWTTANGTTLFLHVLRWPGQSLVLNDFYDRATEVYLLTTKAKLPFKQEGDTLTVTLPATAPDPVDTVIAVRVQKAGIPNITKGRFVNRAVLGEAMANAFNSKEQNAAQAFDGKMSTKWFNSAGGAGWLQYHFVDGAAWAVTRYTLTSGHDVPERDPKDWELQGSQDGVNWVTVDTRHDQQFPTRCYMKAYEIENATAYPYYRLNITANHGAGGLQLTDMRLMTYDLGKGR